MSADVKVEKVKVLNEIIENARELPIEYQECLLFIAKELAFTKDCIAKGDPKRKCLNCVNCATYLRNR